MSFESLSERLTALQESNRQAKELIDRLENIHFQPGSIPLDSGDDNVMIELSSEVQSILKDQDDDFQVLQEAVSDLVAPGRRASELLREKEGLDRSVRRAIKELRGCERAFRRAQIIAREKLQRAQSSERELLLEGLSNATEDAPSTSTSIPYRRNQQFSELTQDEKEINASSDVTLALRRTHEMMASELQRSQFAHDTLEESTRAIQALNETYSSLDTLLSSSRNLLGTLIRSQKSDTWYLHTAFYVLLTTISWLVFRRFIYGPAWWFVYLPVRLVFKILFGIFAATGMLGSKGESGIQSSVSSVISQSTVSHSSGTRDPSQVYTSRAAPSVIAGGGGRGVPIGGFKPRTQQQQGQGSMTDQVERIIAESQNGQSVDQKANGASSDGAAENTADLQHEGIQKNPEKRMWEEDQQDAKQAINEGRKKDEL